MSAAGNSLDQVNQKPERAFLQQLLVAALVAAGHFALVRLSLVFVLPPEGLSPIWLPSGLLLAVLLLLPWRRWALVMGVVFGTTWLSNWLGGYDPLTALSFTLVNCLEPILAAALLNRVAGVPVTFHRLKDVIYLTVVAAMLSNAITAALGALVSALVFNAAFVDAWLIWWLSAGAGMSLVTPVIVLWTRSHDLHATFTIPRVLEAILIFGLLIVASLVVFTVEPGRVGYLVQPVVLAVFFSWAGWRRGPRGAASAGLIATLIGLVFTLGGAGCFSAWTGPVKEDVLNMTLFMSILNLTALALAAAIAEQRASQSAYSTLVENVLEALVIAQYGRIVYANQQMAALTGYSQAELYALPAAAASGLIHPEDRPHVLQIQKERLAGGKSPERFEFRLIRKDGAVRWVESTGVVIEYGEDKASLNTYLDITERKIAEQAVAAREAQLRSIFRAAPVGIGVTVNRVFTEVNDQTLKLLGYTAEELIGQEVRLIYPTDEDYTYVGEELYRQIRENGSATLETRMQRKDGAILNILLNSTPIVPGDMTQGVTFTVLDITERKRAEQAILEREAQLSSIFRAAPTGIGVVVNRVLIEVNDRLCEMIGYTPDELIGQSARIMYPSDEDYEYVGREKYRQIAESGTGTVETRWRRKDGTIIDVLLSSTPIVPENLAQGVTFTALDITERKKMDAELRASEEKYRLLVNSLQEGIWVIDQHERTTFVNPSMADMLGYTTEEMLGRHLFDFMDDHGVELARQNLERRRQGISESHDFEFIRKDGSRIFTLLSTSPILDEQGNYAGAIAGIQDITARRRMETALRQSQERYQQLFTQMPDGFALHEIICDERGKPVDYRFLEVNPAFEVHTGLRVSEIIGRTIREVTPQIEQEWIDVYGKVALSGESVSFENYTAPLDKWFNVSAFCPRLGQFVSVFSDISERKRAEQALRASLEEKTVLLKEVHHRVKNNLNVVSSLLNLQAEAAGNVDVQKILAESQDRIRAIARLHEYLYRSEDLALIDTADYVHDLVNHLYMTYGTALEDLDLQVAVDDLHLDLDTAIPCGLILNELISNALKHAFPQEVKETPGRLSIELHRQEGGICLRVADNGIGLPPAFDIQNTSSLGLQLVAMLSKQLGATLDVQRAAGTVFNICWRQNPKKEGNGK